MNNKWSHLPNAKYIDMILADYKANPKNWNTLEKTEWEDPWNSAWGATWSAALDIVGVSVLNAALQAASTIIRDLSQPIAYNAARDTSKGAILALIAYDNCAYLLDEKPEHVQLLSLLGDNPAATLLYPACKVLHRK